MNDFKYEAIRPIPKEQLRLDLESDNAQTVISALWAAMKYDEDLAWVQEQCLRHLGSPEVAIRLTAASCLGDLAFLRRPLDVSVVIPALERAAEDPVVAGEANFSLSMVRQFLEGPRRSD